jgi:hypothetical protein
MDAIHAIQGSTYPDWRNWIEAAIEALQHYAGQTALLCPSSEGDSWMGSLVRSFYSPHSLPQESMELLDNPVMKNYVELVKKTVDLQHQRSESYIVCKSPCVLTERTQGTLKSSSKKTRCCYTPHYRMNQVPFKVPQLIGVPWCLEAEEKWRNPELVTRIEQMWKAKRTVTQNSTVCIMNHLMEFKTHRLDSPIVFQHRNYIRTNNQGVMYSMLTEREEVMDNYEVDLADSLVWISKKGSPEHPTIHFMTQSLAGEYWDRIQRRHERIWELEHRLDPVFIV